MREKIAPEVIYFPYFLIICVFSILLGYSIDYPEIQSNDLFFLADMNEGFFSFNYYMNHGPFLISGFTLFKQLLSSDLLALRLYPLFSFLLLNVLIFLWLKKYYSVSVAMIGVVLNSISYTGYKIALTGGMDNSIVVFQFFLFFLAFNYYLNNSGTKRIIFLFLLSIWMFLTKLHSLGLFGLSGILYLTEAFVFEQRKVSFVIRKLLQLVLIYFFAVLIGLIIFFVLAKNHSDTAWMDYASMYFGHSLNKVTNDLIPLRLILIRFFTNLLFFSPLLVLSPFISFYFFRLDKQVFRVSFLAGVMYVVFWAAPNAKEVRYFYVLAPYFAIITAVFVHRYLEISKIFKLTITGSIAGAVLFTFLNRLGFVHRKVWISFHGINTTLPIALEFYCLFLAANICLVIYIILLREKPKKVNIAIAAILLSHFIMQSSMLYPAVSTKVAYNHFHNKLYSVLDRFNMKNSYLYVRRTMLFTSIQFSNDFLINSTRSVDLNRKAQKDGATLVFQRKTIHEVYRDERPLLMIISEKEKKELKKENFNFEGVTRIDKDIDLPGPTNKKVGFYANQLFINQNPYLY